MLVVKNGMNLRVEVMDKARQSGVTTAELTGACQLGLFNTPGVTTLHSWNGSSVRVCGFFQAELDTTQAQLIDTYAQTYHVTTPAAP